MDTRKRSVTVVVAYSWSGPVSQDLRWRQIRSMLSKAAVEARGRAARLCKAGIEVEGESPIGRAPDAGRRRRFVGQSLPSIKIARLRATVGSFVWDSIQERIRNADLVVVDLAPSKATDVRPNVWLELGFALACHPVDRVCVVHSEAEAHRNLPSDLLGLMLGHLPDEGRGSDGGLRARLVSTLVGLLLKRTESIDGVGPRGDR